jgi:hypothetical protein
MCRILVTRGFFKRGEAEFHPLIHRAARYLLVPHHSGFLDRTVRSSPSQGTSMMRILMAATAVLCLIGSSAEARSYHHRHRHYAGGGHHSAGRPYAWCGWFMRSQVGSDPGPSYNLARSWAHYGSNAGGPTVGAIVVWPHHVGKIVGQENGKWIIQSGNDGHAVRTRPRSLAGAIAFRNAYAAF